VKYGEPFLQKELMKVEDVVKLECVRSDARLKEPRTFRLPARAKIPDAMRAVRRAFYANADLSFAL